MASPGLQWWEVAARQFEPVRRRWPSPGAMAQAMDRHTRQTPALKLLDDELVDLADGRNERLMFFLPPQEGKSTRVSRRFPAWLLEADPTLRIAIVSYERDSAVRWGRDVKRDLEDPANGYTVRLRADTRAAGRWETEQGGGVYCVGIGGALTGRPVDVLIIDDPVKGRAEAESKVYRDAAWDWWENVALERLSERGRVVLIQTRWHEDDLAGRLMASEGAEWRVVCIPAVAGKRTVHKDVHGVEKVEWVWNGNDPLGRQPGEELVSARRRRRGWFHKLGRKLSAYVWNSVYQQTPTSADGNLFRRSDFRYWNRVPVDPGWHSVVGGVRLELAGQTVYLSDMWRFATVDLAASTRTSADWTVASVWGITPDGQLVLLDRARERMSPTGHWSVVRPLCERWLPDTIYVEAAWIGTTLVIDATKAGVQVEPLKADTDKLTRAIPATNRVAQHRVWFPAQAPWLDEWCDELASFPSGVHDDQVDTLSYAARVILAHWLPPGYGDDSRRRRIFHGAAPDPVQEAHEAETGVGASDSAADFAAMRW